jgi:hypothetical protein
MKRNFGIAIAFAALCALGGLSTQSATAEEINQIKLTEQHVTGFIAAQTDLKPIIDKVQNAESDKPDEAITKELEAVAKKHGFESYAALDDVAITISMVLNGIDPQTGAFTDPVDGMKKEIEDVKADTSIPEAEKKQLLAELEEALKQTPRNKYPENIEIVKKNREALEAALQ